MDEEAVMVEYELRKTEALPQKPVQMLRCFHTKPI
jgi:hypothetical protein